LFADLAELDLRHGDVAEAQMMYHVNTFNAEGAQGWKPRSQRQPL